MLLAASIAGLFLLPLPWNVIGVVVAAIIEVGELHLWRRYLSRHRVRGGAEGLVGERAEVISDCTPEGRVRLLGEIWRAHSSVPVVVGDEVRVVAVDGLTLEVEPGESP
jgi:membrane protein implicated in regulation of membrane protease activity